MEADIVNVYIAIYLGIGLLALFILDCITGRIRRKLKDAAADTQLILAKAGLPLRFKVALLIIAVALWALWPAAIYGAFESLIRKKTRSDDD